MAWYIPSAMTRSCIPRAAITSCRSTCGIRNSSYSIRPTSCNRIFPAPCTTTSTNPHRPLNNALLISRPIAIFLRIFSAALILAAAGFALYQYQTFNLEQRQTVYPAASVIAGIPVGGLSRQQVIDRLNQAYAVPVELELGDQVIQVPPARLGFGLDMDAMLAEADRQQTGQSTWQAFWDYLWQRLPGPVMVPLL